MTLTYPRIVHFIPLGEREQWEADGWHVTPFEPGDTHAHHSDGIASRAVEATHEAD